MRQMLGSDARARVGNGETGKLSRPGVGVGLAIIAVEKDAFGGDEQLTAARHGIPGVDDHIDDHLLDHANVGFDIRQARIIGATQVDIFADDSGEHFSQVADRVVEVERFGLHHLLATESQELAGKVRSAIGRHDDLLETIRAPGRPI